MCICNQHDIRRDIRRDIHDTFYFHIFLGANDLVVDIRLSSIFNE
jgi:hypothetical protein